MHIQIIFKILVRSSFPYLFYIKILSITIKTKLVFVVQRDALFHIYKCDIISDSFGGEIRLYPQL